MLVQFLLIWFHMSASFYILYDRVCRYGNGIITTGLHSFFRTKQMLLLNELHSQSCHRVAPDDKEQQVDRNHGRICAHCLIYATYWWFIYNNRLLDLHLLACVDSEDSNALALSNPESCTISFLAGHREALWFRICNTRFKHLENAEKVWAINQRITQHGWHVLGRRYVHDHAHSSGCNQPSSNGISSCVCCTRHVPFILPVSRGLRSSRLHQVCTWNLDRPTCGSRRMQSRRDVALIWRVWTGVIIWYHKQE